MYNIAAERFVDDDVQPFVPRGVFDLGASPESLSDYDYRRMDMASNLHTLMLQLTHSAVVDTATVNAGNVADNDGATPYMSEVLIMSANLWLSGKVTSTSRDRLTTQTVILIGGCRYQRMTPLRTAILFLNHVLPATILPVTVLLYHDGLFSGTQQALDQLWVSTSRFSCHSSLFSKYLMSSKFRLGVVGVSLSSLAV
jgi:hypothetical protein